MRHEYSHMSFSRKQKIFACILLSIYVPMVLLSSVHLHSIQDYCEAIQCDLCQSSIHHSGHITAGHQHHDECLSCRFLTTQVNLPEATVSFIAQQTVNLIDFFLATEPVVVPVVHPSLRAPPSIL